MPIPFAPPPPEHHPHRIPAWMVPLLSLPIRRIWDKPSRLVLPLIQPGERILEVGPGSGYWTFPMAEGTGPEGKLFCVELQETVRRRLNRKVSHQALGKRIDVRPCTECDLKIQDLEGSIDLAVAIDVLHEIPNPASALQQMATALRSGGKLLIREPRGHCPEPVFHSEIAWAMQAGLIRLPSPWDFGPRVQVAIFQKTNMASPVIDPAAP